MRSFVLSCTLATFLCLPSAAPAQSIADPAAAPSTIPRLMNFNGQLTTAAGTPRSGAVLLTFALYTEQTGGTALWTEQHAALLDAEGRYAVVLGAQTQGGLPADFFVSGAARWLGVAVDAEPEQARFMLVSVAYAFKAGDADTVGGKAPGDFVLNTNLTEKVQAVVKEGRTSTSTGLNTIAAVGTADVIQKGDGLGGSTDTTVPIIEVGGRVGIGTMTPQRLLHVAGVDQVSQFETTNSGSNAILRVIAPNNGQSRFDFGDPDSPTIGRVSYSHVTDSFSFFTNNTNQMTIDSVGRVGIGTASPDSKLNLYASSGPAKITLTAADGLSDPYLDFETNNNEWSFGMRKSDSNKFVFANGDGIALNPILTLTTSGNVGIGTTTPSAKLQVTGNVTVDGNIGAKYQDVAEWVETSTQLEPGTVVIVDPVHANQVIAAPKAYDSRVAGAVSRQPGLVLGERSESKAMVAQSGRVKVKVDATYGAIKIGDLLVTSPTPGFAMRSRPMRIGDSTMHRPGTLLGKALEPLAKGKGEILVLLTLQ